MKDGNDINLPRNYVEIEAEEMMYLDGGAVTAIRGTVKDLKNINATMMSAYGTLAASWATALATCLGSIIGVPLSVMLVAGTAYFSYQFTLHVGAYNRYNKLSQTSSTIYTMYIDTCLGLVTGLRY